jgi:ribosomal protein S18 acetylase RimI-like enzyme
MKHHPALPPSVITVMTSRDAKLIFEVMRDAAPGLRRHLPPGVSEVEDLMAIMRGGVAFFIAYIEDRPVGVLGYRWERSTLRIFHVAVKEQYQRLGVARRLVQAVESVGFALGTTSVSAEVSQEGMHLPFERFGYQAEPVGRGSERVQMHKALRERAV